VRIVVLDLDGPILNGKLRHYSCYSNILREHGFDPMPIEQYWEMKRNRRDLHEQLKVSRADGIYDQFLQLWLERIEMREYLRLDRLQPEAVMKLRHWKGQDICVVLATMRSNSQNLYWQLRSFDILNPFNQVIVIDGHDGSRKAEAVQRRVELSPSKTIWIGDTEADIDAARQIGVKIIAVTSGLRAASYLQSLDPDYLVPDLQSVCLEDLTLC